MSARREVASAVYDMRYRTFGSFDDACGAVRELCFAKADQIILDLHAAGYTVGRWEQAAILVDGALTPIAGVSLEPGAIVYRPSHSGGSGDG